MKKLNIIIRKCKLNIDFYYCLNTTYYERGYSRKFAGVYLKNFKIKYK